MKQLEIFKESIKFVHWGELYAGCKMKWITSFDVLDFCNKGLIKNVSEEDYIDLYLTLNDSLYAFYTRLKEYIIREGYEPIVKNEDETYDSGFTYIPSIYFRIWQLEFLLQIKNKSSTNEEKIEEVSFLFDAMNYPDKWRVFYYYAIDENDNLSISDKYSEFLKYIQEEIDWFHDCICRVG
jgi:hypothetical protein